MGDSWIGRGPCRRLGGFHRSDHELVERQPDHDEVDESAAPHRIGKGGDHQQRRGRDPGQQWRLSRPAALNDASEAEDRQLLTPWGSHGE